MKAIIAGGGIGGLTAALSLNHFGWDAEVVEQASELGDVGAGLQLSPNAMKVFQALGLTQDILDHGFTPKAIELRMGQSGMHLIRAPLGETAQARWGAPYVHIHRADLVRVLETALSKNTRSELRLAASVTSYDQDAAGISVTTQSGEMISGDVLIGADGIHSIVRKQMLGPDQPNFTGNVAWRAIVPVDRLGAHALRPVACAWMGRGKHAVTYLLRSGTLANLVAVVERDDWQKETWTEKGSTEEALADFSDWHPTITHMIKNADSLYRWALFDRAPLERWQDRRATLLGDAAHPMLPFMAQGAAMAIEDSWAIAASLNQIGDIPSALGAYERIRRPRTSAIQAASRANAKTFHQRTLFGQLKTYGPMWIAGQLFPKIGLTRQDTAYKYDICREAAKIR